MRSIRRSMTDGCALVSCPPSSMLSSPLPSPPLKCRKELLPSPTLLKCRNEKLWLSSTAIVAPTAVLSIFRSPSAPRNSPHEMVPSLSASMRSRNSAELASSCGKPTACSRCGSSSAPSSPLPSESYARNADWRRNSSPKSIVAAGPSPCSPRLRSSASMCFGTSDLRSAFSPGSPNIEFIASAMVCGGTCIAASTTRSSSCDKAPLLSRSSMSTSSSMRALSCFSPRAETKAS
mmetsp:Transcript_30781/g.100199  ORF Transcript_30781/g.100199 Transcript_30781/m.100199 type:complete len:234 (-) Transcript_30781:612-1313(-)